MGRPKHGAQSARTKASEKYKNSGRRADNKLKKKKIVEAGGRVKNPYRIKHKTEDMIFDDAMRSMQYDPDEEKKALKENRIYLKPKNVNKTCVR